MTRKEALRERYEDALFALLMDEYADAEGKRLEEENEALQNDPEAAVPESVRRHCMRTIRRCFAARRARSAGRVAAKLLNRVAVVVMVGVMFFTVAFAASPEFRANTLNLVIDVFGEGTTFGLRENERSTGNLSSKVHIELNWVPDGFKLVEYDPDTFGGEEYVYMNNDNELTVSLLGSQAEVTLDTENAQVSSININGYSATQIIKDDVTQLIWADEQQGFLIYIYSFGTTPLEDIIRVAENIIISD